MWYVVNIILYQQTHTENNYCIATILEIRRTIQKNLFTPSLCHRPETNQKSEDHHACLPFLVLRWFESMSPWL